MPIIDPFYSINESQKPVSDRVYHDNSTCAAGRDIPESERRSGIGGFRHCTNCQRQTEQGR
jgi:hypothetical protein